MSVSTPLPPLLKTLPPAQRLLANIIRVKEGAGGLSHTKFVQDTAIAWLPKMAVSRSKAETSEISLLEFVESALIYYAIPLVGGKLFLPLFQKLARSPVQRAHLLKPLAEIPLKELSKSAQKSVLPVKAAMIIASIAATAIGGEYVLNFAKNLMTAKVYKKTDFSDVVNLSTSSAEKPTDESPTVQKARRRIKQALAVAGALVAGSMLLARFGRGQTIQKFLEPFVRKFDFTFANGKLGLGRNQMLTYMGIGYLSYIDAARDKLERVEVASRVGLILGYLAFGQELIDKAVAKIFGKAKPLAQLAAETAGNPAAFRKALATKSAVTFIPLLFGMLVAGLGVGLMSRLWTSYRFKKTQTQSSPAFTGGSDYQAFVKRLQIRASARNAFLPQKTGLHGTFVLH